MSKLSESSEEGVAVFIKCKMCRIKFHEDYIKDKLCSKCFKLSNYICGLCEHSYKESKCTPNYCANKWNRCSNCYRAYYEDHIIDGWCERCNEHNGNN